MFLIIIGLFITAVGLAGSRWANNYNPGWEARLEYLLDGTSTEQMDAARFWNSNGTTIIVIGVALIIVGVLIEMNRKKQRE